MSSRGNNRFSTVNRLLSYFAGSEVEDAKGEKKEKKERRKDEMDLHFGQKFLVLGFVVALVAGLTAAASAIEIQDYPEIRLLHNQELIGHPGNAWLGRELISIGDTIQVRVTATPPESVDYVIANLCAYGGGTHDTLYHFQGRDAWISGFAWIPSCSDGASSATMSGLALWDVRDSAVVDETWQIWYDDDSGDWEAIGNLSGSLTALAEEDSLYYAINGDGDTLFTFTISGVSDVCCNTQYVDCDHFEFETHAPLQADSTFVKEFAVQDGGECWIDHNPCWYDGHWDAKVLAIACDTSVAFCDSANTLWPGITYDGEDYGGDSLWVDTHWTKYAQLEDPAGYGAEFIESNDYTFEFDTENAGLSYFFGLEDEILNPTTGGAPDADRVCAFVDMRKLAHENGNDDIDSLYFDLSSLGDAYADITIPNVNENGYWFIENPNYYDIDCSPAYNGWEADSVLTLCWHIAEGHTDVAADVEYIMMWWISDSGDTTFFPVPTHKLVAIDNIIPALTDTSLVEPRDSVDVDDISFDVDMTLAGNDDVLNPVSEGNPTPDWAKVLIDLEGLYDLDDVTDGGQAWADMRGIGVHTYEGTDPAPFDSTYFRPMGPTSPTWETEEIDVAASPPSPYPWDQDSILADVWVFDNAGNAFVVGPGVGDYPIDNMLPILPDSICERGPFIYAEIQTDVAFKTGIANVGAPLEMECAGLYNDRDEIVLHANLGSALGVDEVGDVEYVTDAYDPFCVGGITLFDDGTHGSDPVTDDKNFTGHARIEVGGSTRNDTTFCVIDTDGDSLGFSVLVTDDAGNAAINSACQGIRVDNEVQTMSPEHVAMYFYDDPETIELDGDKNGDGIVSVGDLLIFEWRLEDEPWEDGEIILLGIVRVDLASIDPSWSGYVDLDRIPSGGIWRNYYPDEPGPFGDLFEVPPGTVDGAQLQAKFTNWDNAGNTPGWCLFMSDLTLDNVGPAIDCDSVAITVSGADTIAAIGDTIFFSYDGPDDGVATIGVDVSGVTALMDTLYLTHEGDAWTGWVVVQEGTLDDESTYFGVKAFDGLGNTYSCSAGPISVDNEPPTMACGNAWLRLWDYNDNVTSPTRVVNTGDNLTAIYWDEDGDIERVTADFSNYYGTEMVYEMVSEFAFGPPEKWGYRVDPIPDGTIDEPAGGIGTKVLVTAYDDAGNVTSEWLCPMWYNESFTIGGDNWLYNHGGLCSSCLPVDTERPEAVDPDAITFELLETSNGIANVGDRLRVIVNMGDPTSPGYDMQWSSAFVQADIGQYGNDYYCGDLDNCDYLFLTDDGYSAGGEGDGRFSYFFWYDASDGWELVEGAPITLGVTELPAGDDGTKIRVRAMDDAGNFSLAWTYSDVLVLAGTDTPVPVDNYVPEVDPADIHVSFVDEDENGICDIGDEVTVSVDMTDALGGPVAAVYAHLYDWGFPSQDLVPLELETLLAGTPAVYSKTFTVERNPGDFCATQEDGAVGFEDQSGDVCKPKNGGDLLVAGIYAEMEVVAKDESDNWSAYEFAGAPSGGGSLLALPTPSPSPSIQDWVFVFDWTSSGDLTDMLVDTDAPDPVNPTFPYPSIPASGVQSFELVDGRIGIQLFYKISPRNVDVDEFYVYGDLAIPGEVDFDTYLGAPIPAGMVPTSNNLGGNYEWVSDVLPERADDPETPLDESVYHFAVLAVDNANNYSDPALTWITGISADATAPEAFVEVVYGESQNPCTEEGQPTAIGNADVQILGYLTEATEYINAAYVELWARIKDLDPSTAGDQPGEWKVVDEVGDWPPPATLPVAPFEFDADGLGTAFGDLTKCTTFELAAVAWDEAGNHLTPDEVQKFVFTYDIFEPVMTMFAINGNPSPYDMELSGSGLIEVTALDECPVTSDLTYWLYLKKIGGENLSYGPLLTRVTLPAGEPFTYNWDLVNYPAGQAQVDLYVCDQAGNYAYHFKRIQVIDESAPTGVFASMRFWDLTSHPYYTKLLDGMSIPNRKDLPTYFWVQWPGELAWPSTYDVGQVKLEYRMRGDLSEWTTLGILTDYADTVSWNDDFYVGYEFIWDSSIFSDGDQIDLKATVMDEVGNEETVTIWVKIAAEAPILALSIPEAVEACGETRVRGDINIVATENGETNPIDTYFVSFIYKKSTFPDLGDCNAFDTSGWVMWPDTLMIEGHPTSETIWRATLPTSGLEDGSYDIALTTIDVAGNYSWDMNRDWCVDAGYFAQCVANGMGMTVVVQNSAPEIRIRSVNNFEAVDEGVLWSQPVYVQRDGQLSVVSWTASTCDIAQVDYYLTGDDVIDGDAHVGTSTDGADGYPVTFPPTGGIDQYLEPDAFQYGYAVVSLWAVVTDVLGNISTEYTHAVVPVWILDTTPTSAFVTTPAPGEYVRNWVDLEADVMDNEAVYDITYQYRAVGDGAWTTIAVTKPHDGDPWDTDINGFGIEWNTDLLADGDYELRAVSRDANLTVDPDPVAITVHVDNTPPTVDTFAFTPTYEVGEALPTAPSTYVGGPHLELSVNATDDGFLDHVHFMYKAVDADLDSAMALARDDQAPYAYDWITGFTAIPSGWYHLIAKAEDKAGNETYATELVYVDQYAPYGWISQINSDITPDGSNFYGVLTLNGICEDNVPESMCMAGHNQKFDSGLMAGQFQYQAVSGGGYLGVTTEGQSGPCPTSWVDLGAPVTDAGPDYSMNWDTGTLVPGDYYLRIVGIDNVDNRADVDGAPSLPYVTISIVDQIAPKAIIAGVDDVSGYIWATTDTHGQNDIAFVRFEYKPATAQAEWTVIGEVDAAICTGLYGLPWHFEPLAGNFWVRAVAYDDDYDVVDFPDLYDKTPAMMFITIASHKVTMQSTSFISSLTRWGNLDDYDEVAVKAVCASGQPTVIVVYDNDPEDHFNVPTAVLLDLERPDNPAEWVDYFSLGGLGDWGISTIIGTYNNSGTVGAKTSTVKVFRVTDAEGTKGVVSQDKMSVNIPSGAIYEPSEGLIVINVQRPYAEPTLDEIIPVSDAVMFNLIGDERYEYFDNGLRADVTLEYNQSEITGAMNEANLRVAHWSEDQEKWHFGGIGYVSVNTTTNVVTFKAERTGTYAVVSATTFRITQPVYYPGCKVGGATYTSEFPKFMTIVEDVINGIDEPDIKVTIDGPAGNKVFDNLTIYYEGDAIYPWIDAEYDEVGHILGISVDPGYSWSEGDWRWGTGAWSGLPGGVYTLKIEALNTIGDRKTLTDVFTVDAGVPTLDFAGTYVAANPSFSLDVHDALSGVDPTTVFLDVYAINSQGYQTENKEYLGTATPSAMTYDSETGEVTFQHMTFGETLSDGMSIDVIVYDGHLPFDYYEEGWYGGQVLYNGCNDSDDHQCRYYYSEQGIADCVGNHANPVWRRFTVDAACPTLTLLSGESDMQVEVQVVDPGSGIPYNVEEDSPFDIMVDGVAFYDYEFVPTSNNHIGILRFTVDAGAAEIEVTARDAVGNFCVLEINKGAEVVDVTDVKSYPNPFDPYSGEYATISFDLSKRADVLIKIMDFAGEHVATVADGWYDTGIHTVNWFGTDGNGKTVASGAYIGYVRIDDGSKVVTKNLKIGVAAKGNED